MVYQFEPVNDHLRTANDQCKAAKNSNHTLDQLETSIYVTEHSY